MTALSVWFPFWACDAARRRWRLDAARPIVLTRVEHQREIVAARCPRACKAGVALGMTLAHARALLPGEGDCAPFVTAHDPPADTRALHRVAARATRLLPIVQPDPPDGLLLDAWGCERLYGSAASIVARAHAWAKRVGTEPRVASAPTFRAAWALARFGGAAGTSINAAELPGALLPLPIAALNPDAATRERLAEVGVERIGELLALPRGAVAARCGDGVLRTLDRALGRAPEVIEGVRSAAPLTAEREFDGPTDRIESVEACAREALASLIEQLRNRECGCRRIVIRLDRSDLPPVRIEARASAPTRDERHWWSILADKVATAHLGFGVEAVRAWAGGLARLPHEQASAVRPTLPVCDDAAVSRLADTLIARLGAARVLTPGLLESHTPERASTLIRWDESPHAGASGASGASGAGIVRADRPLSLHDRPSPLRVTLLAPEGPILLVGDRAESARVIASIGPERIEGEWWRGDRSIRDYYALALENGRRLWVFRRTPGDAWFLHGEWA